jgi:hypothetical protein
MQLLDLKMIENHPFSKPRCVDFSILKLQTKVESKKL